jgi:uncharacterized protein YndB with AHSA1/START domain
MSERQSATPTGFSVHRDMDSSPHVLYEKWVLQFDSWFCEPGAIVMEAHVGKPYWFGVVFEGRPFSHYGRFLALEQDRLIEQTWMSGRGGTDGAETIVRVELVPNLAGTSLTLHHTGFYDEESANRHSGAWPTILGQMDSSTATS